MSSTVVDASGSDLNALNAASGEVSISSGTRITADYNRNAVEASGTSSVSKADSYLPAFFSIVRLFAKFFMN